MFLTFFWTFIFLTLGTLVQAQTTAFTYQGRLTDGVALAAIEGLNEELKDRDAKIERQQQQLKDQQQLTGLQEQIKQQQSAIEELKKLFCAGNSTAETCKEENK